jgi:exodeoxyribonuclease VII large subunit
LDVVATRLGRPSNRLAAQRLRLSSAAHQLQAGLRSAIAQRHQHLQYLGQRLPLGLARGMQVQRQCLEEAALKLDLLDPKLVLQRGYAWLQDDQGQTVISRSQVAPGQSVSATLADGTVDLTVKSIPL